MATILPENEMTEVEGRVYINPQTGIDTTNAFIENLRQTQQANTQQIAQDTANLGTEVPSNLGGLTGGTGYWTSRYQAPQTNAAVANLRAAAQAQALNEVLANEQAIWKNRYQQAYRDYQKRQNIKANTPIVTRQSSPNENGTLGVDTNTSTGDTIEVSQYQPEAGQIIPNTDYVSDYQDASTGNWYQLISPKEIDVIKVQNSLEGRNPADGKTVAVNGRTLRYVAATDSWYEQINSAGPNTYSPRAW